MVTRPGEPPAQRREIVLQSSSATYLTASLARNGVENAGDSSADILLDLREPGADRSFELCVFVELEFEALHYRLALSSNAFGRQQVLSLGPPLRETFLPAACVRLREFERHLFGLRRLACGERFAQARLGRSRSAVSRARRLLVDRWSDGAGFIVDMQG